MHAHCRRKYVCCVVAVIGPGWCIIPFVEAWKAKWAMWVCDVVLANEILPPAPFNGTATW